MGVGYVIGCLASIIFWKFDRTTLFIRINNTVKKVVKDNLLLQILYLTLIILIVIVLNRDKQSEFYNFITAFLVIDVSNTERKNLNLREKTHFYDSISIISRSVLCGFISPLLLIIVLGNNYAISYMLLYNLNYVDNFNMIRVLFTVLTIIPSLITQAFLYFIYLIRNRRVRIDFKGDYLINCITRPLLNVDILGAYIESVNFYYYFNDKNMHYLKSYGEYTNKIDEICVKDYLSIAYGICLLTFVIFFFMIRIL